MAKQINDHAKPRLLFSPYADLHGLESMFQDVWLHVFRVSGLWTLQDLRVFVVLAMELLKGSQQAKKLAPGQKVVD